MATLQAVLDWLQTSSGLYTVGLALVLEFVARLVPTKQPWGALHALGAALKLAGSVLNECGLLLDKVLPQNVAK